MKRALGVSPVDLSNSPRKLGVKFNDRVLLGMVDASTISSNLTSWVSRMVLCIVWVK